MFTNTYRKALFIGAIVMIVLLSGCTSTSGQVIPWKLTPNEIKENINNWDERTQINALSLGEYHIGNKLQTNKNTGKFIQYIKNPSTKVQIAAVTGSYSGSPNDKDYNNYPFSNIQYIKNPNGWTIDAAVDNIGTHINHRSKIPVYKALYKMINPPDEYTTLLLLNRVWRTDKQEVSSFFCDENGHPTVVPEELLSTIMIEYPSATKCIQNFNKELQLQLIQKNPANIRYIKNPDEDMQLAAVAHYGKFIRYIKNPTKKVQLKAVKSIEYCQKGMDHPLKYISNPSEQLVITAILICPYSIDYVSNPSKKAKILAFGRVDIEKPNFKVSDKNIELTVTNGQIKIKNKTNKFVKIISLAEYHGENVYTITAHSLPPKSVQKVYSPKKGTVITVKNLLDDKYIQFGYAIEYKVGNGSVKNLYLVKKYPVNKFL